MTPRMEDTIRTLTDMLERYQMAKGIQDIRWYVVESTIEPGRAYITDGRAAIFATEMGVSGRAEAELVAAMFNELPHLLFTIIVGAGK